MQLYSVFRDVFHMSHLAAPALAYLHYTADIFFRRHYIEGVAQHDVGGLAPHRFKD